MKTNKSPGEDGLGVSLYKVLLPKIMDSLLLLFNNVLILGKFPEDWSKGKICPIYKQREIRDPNNYRGIYLLNILEKIFSKILNKSINDFLE
jgi:hypothetical protein